MHGASMRLSGNALKRDWRGVSDWPDPDYKISKLRINRRTLAFAALLAAAAATLAYAQSLDGMRLTSSGATAALSSPPPPPAPMTLRPLAPAAAFEINRAIPFTRAPNPPAEPFRFRGTSATYDRALTCLTSAVYYEAGSESEAGQQAVAQVVLNRVRHPAFPGSICAVVYQGSTLPTGCQFTFTCDGSLDRAQSKKEWARAENVAAAALAGSVFPPVGYATNYHANFVVPYWASSHAKVAVVGAHIFYHTPGAWGSAAAFRRPYASSETDPIMLRAIALAARQQRGSSQSLRAKPQIIVNADPRVELLNVVAMLASRAGPAGNEEPFKKAVRARFSPFSEHLAVQLFRQLSLNDDQFVSRAVFELFQASPAPQNGAALVFPDFVFQSYPAKVGSGFAEALRDFARQTQFADFFASQQPYYKGLSDPYQPMADLVVTRFQDYTGVSAGRIRFVSTSMVGHAVVAGNSADGHSSDKLLVLLVPQVDSRAGQEPSANAVETGKLLGEALVWRAFGPVDCPPSSAPKRCTAKNSNAWTVQDQLAKILANRVVPLSKSNQRPRDPDPSGISLAIAEALKTYEQNRALFPAFNDFHPFLLETLLTHRRMGAPRRAAAAG